MWFTKSLARHSATSRGFSLIELIIAVAIVAILAAVAVPIFLNQREKAYQSALTTDVRHAIDALHGAKPINGSFSDAATTYAAVVTNGRYKATPPNRIVMAVNCRLTGAPTPTGFEPSPGDFVIIGVRQTAPANGSWTGTLYYYDSYTNTWTNGAGGGGRPASMLVTWPNSYCTTLSDVNG